MTEAAPGVDNSKVLAEASPSSLDELFSRDPEELTEQELGKIVDELIAQSARFASAEAAKVKPPRKAGPQAALGLGLKDLGL